MTHVISYDNDDVIDDSVNDDIKVLMLIFIKSFVIF